MSPDIVPTKTDVIAVVRIDAKLQQFVFDARTSKTTLGLLVITISKIPKDVIASPINIIGNCRGIFRS